MAPLPWNGPSLQACVESSLFFPQACTSQVCELVMCCSIVLGTLCNILNLLPFVYKHKHPGSELIVLSHGQLCFQMRDLNEILHSLSLLQIFGGFFLMIVAVLSPHLPQITACKSDIFNRNNDFQGRGGCSWQMYAGLNPFCFSLVHAAGANKILQH